MKKKSFVRPEDGFEIHEMSNGLHSTKWQRARHQPGE